MVRIFAAILGLSIGSSASHPYCAPIVCQAGVAVTGGTRHEIPREHPRILGSRSRLRELSKQRPDAYQRTIAVARGKEADEWSKMISTALVCTIQRDEQLGREAVQKAMTYINGPIKKGHVPFGTDLAMCAIAYDLCHEYWTQEQRLAFHAYMNKTVEANVDSETHVFHNGWYGYKHWGIGLACYATYYENERAPAILKALERDWKTRAAPALNMAGDGGGWAEGYYINYWLYEWLFFCEAARLCDGADYYADAPKFFTQRAIASGFETYPGIGIYGSRRPIPMGDSGGRVFGGDRDKALSARRILVNYFRDRADHQAVHAFNETTPRSSVGVFAYKDLLWRDMSVAKADLSTLPLSHISSGPGYVCARSSWDENATYFFFKCGDRFTAHQHLDVGHFLIYKHEELLGDGGHYDSFGSSHDVNYHLRSIAHNTILICDPCETWPLMRAGPVTGNDGGQWHRWKHHNGAAVDVADWEKGRQTYDIADILAFEDRGDYLYVAGDCTRAYKPDKVEYFTRQIVFLRPGTFVIFDRVCSKKPDFKKTFLLQAMNVPSSDGQSLVVTNGKGRLFINTLLPAQRHVRLVSGEDLYSYGGKGYPPARDTGPAPQCRIEISPAQPATLDYFLNVLTATDAGSTSVQQPTATLQADQVIVNTDSSDITFRTAQVGGNITIAGNTRKFTDRIVVQAAQSAK